MYRSIQVPWTGSRRLQIYKLTQCIQALGLAEMYQVLPVLALIGACPYALRIFWQPHIRSSNHPWEICTCNDCLAILQMPHKSASLCALYRKYMHITCKHSWYATSPQSSCAPRLTLVLVSPNLRALYQVLPCKHMGNFLMRGNCCCFAFPLLAACRIRQLSEDES